MSIRHYNPRRRRRGGISPNSRNFLYGLVGLTIALQISYPLIGGEALRIVTIATVYAWSPLLLIQILLAISASNISLWFGNRISWLAHRVALWHLRI